MPQTRPPGLPCRPIAAAARNLRRKIRSLLLGPSALVCALFLAPAAHAVDDYKLGTDSFPQPNTPHGTVTKSSWVSKIFPGTVRDYWVYVPAQYDAKTPACLMVFQDGGGYQSVDGQWRVPVVFDNLIHRKEMPVTIGVFINPGVVPAARPDALPRFNRSYEYDGLGDSYARFLLEEILPEVTRLYNIATDPGSRAIGGASSGAIAAFTAAWERPDQFGRVFSTIGTYVGQRGGDRYPTLIRKTEPKPLRIFLQDGSTDQNIYGGNWWLANQTMLSALQFAGYEVTNVWGDGGHNSKHGGAILPEAMRWLWKDHGTAIKTGAGSKQPVLDVVSVDDRWQLVAGGFKFAEETAANDKGEIFVSDGANGRIHKIAVDGNVRVFVENSSGSAGLTFGAAGQLYAAQNGRKRIVSYDSASKETVIATNIESSHVAVSQQGNVYVTDPKNKSVWLFAPHKAKRIVDTGITFPSGVLLSPDQSLLYVADRDGQFVYSFQVQPDGGLAFKQPYYHLHMPDGKTDSGAEGMAADTLGRLYVATHLGLQVCDQAGRVTGIISKPQPGAFRSVTFGGPKLDQLFVTAGNKLYRRNTKASGVLSSQTPIKPPTPRL